MNKRNIFFLIAPAMVVFLCLFIVLPIQVAGAQSGEGEEAFAVSSEKRLDGARQRRGDMTPEQQEKYRAKMGR